MFQGKSYGCEGEADSNGVHDGKEKKNWCKMTGKMVIL